MSKVIFWDFQGTLAKNDWMFSKALYKVLSRFEPETHITIEDFKKKQMLGFPWQEPEKAYLHLTSNGNWWKHVEHIFIDFYKQLGITEEKSISLARRVKTEIIESNDFSLYDDTIEVLSYFTRKKFTNIILSNHIPELEKIVDKLGLSQYISLCISSANVGYEKPHPEIYRYALGKVQFPEVVWMVGDNIAADVWGAESVGIKGVLVRSKTNGTVKYHSGDLRGLKRIIV